VYGDVLAVDNDNASNRQIRRDGLADYSQYIGGDQRYRPCILLFEPNTEIRRFIASLLQHDYLVLCVPDEGQLLEWVKREQPDLILADVLGAKPDALALILQLSQDQACRHIPLLVLAGFKDLVTKTECLQAGAVDYLSKPFHAAELLLKIRNQIRQRIAFTLLADKSHYLARLQTDVAARDLRFTKRLDDVVTAHYPHIDFSIPALAALLGYSERQLQRRCLRSNQSSPAEYLLEFRLQRAKVLLQQGQPVKVVAYSCGFSSDQYFSKCYKKRFGITPAMQQK
jgi:DNA-binding response OmpR family regulator